MIVDNEGTVLYFTMHSATAESAGAMATGGEEPAFSTGRTEVHVQG